MERLACCRAAGRASVWTGWAPLEGPAWGPRSLTCAWKPGSLAAVHPTEMEVQRRTLKAAVPSVPEQGIQFKVSCTMTCSYGRTGQGHCTVRLCNGLRIKSIPNVDPLLTPAGCLCEVFCPKPGVFVLPWRENCKCVCAGRSNITAQVAKVLKGWQCPLGRRGAIGSVSKGPGMAEGQPGPKKDSAHSLDGPRL